MESCKRLTRPPGQGIGESSGEGRGEQFSRILFDDHRAHPRQPFDWAAWRQGLIASPAVKNAQGIEGGTILERDSDGN